MQAGNRVWKDLLRAYVWPICPIEATTFQCANPEGARASTSIRLPSISHTWTHANRRLPHAPRNSKNRVVTRGTISPGKSVVDDSTPMVIRLNSIERNDRIDIASRDRISRRSNRWKQITVARCLCDQRPNTLIHGIISRFEQRLQISNAVKEQLVWTTVAHLV